MIVRDDALAPGDDPFVIIGVPRSAPPAVIKEAFRQKARLLHPDVSDDPDASQNFRKCVAAYAILSHGAKRAEWLSAEAWRPRSSSSAPPEPVERPWMDELADSNWVRIALAMCFVGGQWLTWWLFLYGVGHIAAPAQAMCGLGPCPGV